MSDVDRVGAEEEVARVFRAERLAVLATLIRETRDFDLAEDAVQDAFAAALTAWPRDGVPDRAGAWIMVTARRRAIDLLRRDRSRADRAARLADALRLREHPPAVDDSVIDDDRLRLVFTCCHPALDMSARVALTLRAVGGLTTGEIARAFLVSEPTMGKRIVRAKRKIAGSHVRFRVPDTEDLTDRVRGVLRVVYLIFNEGYSAGDGEHPVRADLCLEAIRLGRLLCELVPADTEARGLLALMLLTDARRTARVDGNGRYVSLGQQDRARWDQDRIREGLDVLRRANRPGEYQIQAAIAALHLAETPDWATTAHLYDRLRGLVRSPVVAVNHAVAVGFADGPAAGLNLLTPLLKDPAVARYQPLYAAHADLLRRAGRRRDAASAYRRAIELTTNPVERAELVHRLGSD